MLAKDWALFDQNVVAAFFTQLLANELLYELSVNHWGGCWDPPRQDNEIERWLKWLAGGGAFWYHYGGVEHASPIIERMRTEGYSAEVVRRIKEEYEGIVKEAVQDIVTIPTGEGEKLGIGSQPVVMPCGCVVADYGCRYRGSWTTLARCPYHHRQEERRMKGDRHWDETPEEERQRHQAANAALGVSRSFKARTPWLSKRK